VASSAARAALDATAAILLKACTRKHT